MLVVAMLWAFSGSDEDEGIEEAEGKAQVSTDAIMNRQVMNQNWMSRYDSVIGDHDNRIKSVEHTTGEIDELQNEIDALRQEKQDMVSDGTRVFEAYERENAKLKQELEAAKTSPQGGAPGPAQAAAAAGIAPGAVGQQAAPIRKEVKLVKFSGSTGTANRIDAKDGSTSFTDSPNYLPPNSIAAAKVIVGVDAATNVRSQTDPLPVVLRITGPARSVYDEGKLLRTRIDGCMVNGAAQGDLSSEKVYVRLQRMTCRQAGGRIAVSEVKGFIAFGGKVGVRGKVVSREGGLIGQAFLAGLAGGFGRGFSANTNSVFSGTNVSVDGKRDKLSTSDILEGGIGEGIATAGDQVSEYLIERAEQYQPVIEMPTGADVEVVFLDGVFIQN
ncbi:TraB/VirB10 family protein [Altericroceibacterium spongiae]|uniref:TraB/VirB10 family protein n=1 Tax=Altericroceibacterium spongiae TaxID=2320269 RepID=UPI003B75CD5B